MVVVVVESERDTRGARSQLTTRIDLRLSDEELDKNANSFAAYHMCACELLSSDASEVNSI
jgi:hypothetical protein